MEEAEKLFEWLSTRVGDRHVFRNYISGSIHSSDSFEELANAGLNFLIAEDLISIEDYVGKGVMIRKEPDFYKAIKKGGLNDWIKYKDDKAIKEQEKSDKERELIKSSIRTNKSTILLAIITTVILIVQTFMQCNSNNNEYPPQQNKELKTGVQDNTNKQEKKNYPLQKETDSLTKAPQK